MMNNLNVVGLNPVVAGKITPMVEDLLREHASNIHSFHLVGSSVIPDYNEKLSDINTVLVLNTMDLRRRARTRIAREHGPHEHRNEDDDDDSTEHVFA